MRICITGGIACGKSLLSFYLRELGVEIVDADDIVHELIPAEERKRLAKVVFSDPEARRALEARIHPLVKQRINERLAAGRSTSAGLPPIAVIPLLFETHWDGEYDIICCVSSCRATQIDRMMTTRGYTREEAEARLAAQMPVKEKVAKSHYVIENDGSAEELKLKVAKFVNWLKEEKKV